MRPAFSVVFLTTLIGAGQGLFLALFAADLLGRFDALAPVNPRFLTAGSSFAALLALLGLGASFFHLGRPLRAWRSAARWRTSWLAREVIALPAFIALTVAYGVANRLHSPAALALGFAALVACATLFVCTAMIYAGIRFLQEWASPFTLPNFVLMGGASGFTLATAFAATFAPRLADFYGRCAVVLIALGLAMRVAALRRNARLRPRSTAQSAIGVPAARVEQKSQGFTGESFNTREFFHGVTPAGMRAVRWTFLALAFAAPLLLVAAGLGLASVALLALAPLVQYVGLIAERWYFLADANHPQNLYYQSRA